MKSRRLIGFLSLILLVGLVQVPLVMAAEKMAGERDLSRVRKKVEALRAWQLTEALNLDEGTSARLFPVMKEADQERWRLELSNRDLVRKLSRTLDGPKPDPEAVNKILDELQSNRRRLLRVDERHMEKVRQILSPVDAARYLIFQIKFRREIRRKVAEAVRDRNRPDRLEGPGGSDRMDDRSQADGGFDPDGDAGGRSGGGRR